MPKIIKYFLLYFVLVQGIYAQSADEIITRYVEKIGGGEKLNKIHSIKITGAVIADTMRIPLILEIKDGEKIRLTLNISGKDIIQVYDGKEGWYINPYDVIKTPQPLDKEDIEDLKESIDWKGKLVDYISKGIKANISESDDICCYKIQLTDINSSVNYYYIDKQTGLLRKTLITKDGVTEETKYSDYREIGGILFAFLSEKKVTVNNITDKSQNIIEKVDLNISLEDSIFSIK